MSKITCRINLVLLSIVAFLSLQGCATSQSIPADKFYRLSIEAKVPSSYKSIPINGKLAISRFSTDALHSERPMLYSSDNSGLVLNQYHYHHWIDSPANMIQEQMVRYFKDSGASGNVYTTGTSHDYEYLLKGKIFRFESVISTSSRVDIEMEITLLKKTGQEIVLTRRYKKEIPVNGDSMHEVVINFNSGLSEIFDSILKDITSYCRISQKCS